MSGVLERARAAGRQAAFAAGRLRLRQARGAGLPECRRRPLEVLLGAPAPPEALAAAGLVYVDGQRERLATLAYLRRLWQPGKPQQGR